MVLNENEKIMKPTNDTNILDLKRDAISIQRQAIPVTTSLQKSIIRETQNLAQQKSANRFYSINRKLINSYKSFTNNAFRFQAVAATTVIIVTTIIITMNQTINLSVKPIEPIDQAVWEDLWLMQDELAFAEL